MEVDVHAADSRTERGMVTAEIAVALTGLVVVVLGLLWVFAVVTAQIRCVDAARDTARAVARGETIAASRAEGARSAPAGATFGIQLEGEQATGVVSAKVRPTWPVLSHLPGVSVRGRAVVTAEPGVGE
jgi:Flp pilus assembly protein TadG